MPNNSPYLKDILTEGYENQECILSKTKIKNEMELETTYVNADGVEIDVIVSFSIEDNSFDHEYGTQYVPPSLYIESVEDKEGNEIECDTEQFESECWEGAESENEWMNEGEY